LFAIIEALVARRAPVFELITVIFDLLRPAPNVADRTAFVAKNGSVGDDLSVFSARPPHFGAP
jgi:hypothetical protein